jgi:hypothetical protein
MEVNITKLQQFVEAAISNPRHPVYQAGMAKSPALQHYALNVSMLGAVKAEDWFVQYPEWTGKLNEVMVYCEAEQAADAAAQTEEQKLRATVDDLNGKVAGLMAKIEAMTPPAAPAAEPPAAA